MNGQTFIQWQMGRRLWFIHSLLLIKSLVHANVIYTPESDFFPVTVIHTNDFHARFEETDINSKTCKPGAVCIGGLARMWSVIEALKMMYQNPIYLNAGDNYQGTLFYTLGKWNVTQHFMNICKPDVMTIGNHEFDNGIGGLVPFLEHAEFPAVACNIDDSNEPSIQGKYSKSIVIDRYERKIGVIGVVNSHYNEIANTGQLRFYDESQSVKVEAAKLKQQGVDIIIVLSHCGYDVDQIIAQEGGPHISAIVGGHSHSFLFTGSNPPGPDKPVGDYPTIVMNPAGHKVPIVQASALTKYVGDLTIWFDQNGKAVRWSGAPIFLGNEVMQHHQILDELKPWKAYIDSIGSHVVGHSSITMERDGCNSGECALGDFITDIFVNHYATKATKAADEWTAAAIAIVNTGGLRTTIEKGDISYADLISTIPFDNTVDLIELRGEHIWNALEHSVANDCREPQFFSRNMLQISGLQVVFNITNPIGRRVQSVNVLCNKCRIPKYEPLIKENIYPVITISFLLKGGDGFKAISDHFLNRRIGPVDIDIAIEYLKSVQTYKPMSNIQRITILK